MVGGWSCEVGMTKLTAQARVGSRVARVEDDRFLTGHARYVDDIDLPAQLHAVFVRSDQAHADIVDVDVSQAARSPGVAAVVTGSDIVDAVAPIVCDSTLPEAQPSLYPTLAADRVRFVGEAVAVVVADTPYQAEDAAGQVRLDLQPRPVVASIEDTERDDLAPIHPGWNGHCFVDRWLTNGNPAAVFEKARGVASLNLAWGRQAGTPLETRGCVARLDAPGGMLTMWTATQLPHLIRTGLADCLEFPEHRIRVVSPDVGGGFGVKAQLYPEEVVVAHLARGLGRPVKWTEDRREHFLAASHAREHRHYVKAAYDERGVVTALRADIVVNCGAYSLYPWTATLEPSQAAGALPGPYRIQDFECHLRGVATNRAPLGPYRGVSLPMACFSIERVMDRVARLLHMDPVEVRRRNLVQPDEFPYRTATGRLIDSGSFVESLETACRIADYSSLRREQARNHDEGRLVGIGVACCTEQTAHTTTTFVRRGIPIIFGYDSASVRVDPSGTVTVQASTHSHGQGHETTYAQIVAEALGIDLENVRVAFGDTAVAPYGMGTFASRSAVLAGGAAHVAATRVREQLLMIAAHNLEVDVRDLEMERGDVRVRGVPARAVSVAELARWAYHRPERLPPGAAPSLEATETYDAPPGEGTFSNSCHLAVVEVDAETGGLTILRYLVIEDCGRMINPTIVDGQVHGGVAQGVGDAVLEELIYDEQAQPLTASFMDYAVPSAVEVPPIELAHLETPSPYTIGGVKGMGEGGAIPPGAVLAAAVEDALRTLGQCDVIELPLTPERVMSLACQAQQDGPDLRRPSTGEQ